MQVAVEDILSMASSLAGHLLQHPPYLLALPLALISSLPFISQVATKCSWPLKTPCSGTRFKHSCEVLACTATASCRLVHHPTGGHQVQVALEDILSLASSLAGHLLEHPPVTEPRSPSSSPPRKSRSRRGTSAEAGDGAAAAGNTGAGL